MVQFDINDTEITDEYIYYTHNYLNRQIQKALEVIKEYIINNNLLIVGGTAIDYALKLKNQSLYNDLYQVPDFDIISPNNIDHANNIGKILCEMKYTNISIVPAIHHTTVRVQLLGFTLFDSTYVPEYIYNKIPFLEYNEMKFVDPNFQKINQYLSLSFLFKITGPSYNVLNRFKKDVERLDLLQQFYQLMPNSTESNIDNNSKIISKKFTFKYKLFNLTNIDITDNNSQIIKYKSINEVNDKFINKYHIHNNIYYHIESNLIFHGVLAYNLLYSEFDRIYSKLYDILPLNKDDKEFIKCNYQNITMHKKYIINETNNELIFDIYNTELCILNSQSANSNSGIKQLLESLKKEYKIDTIIQMESILDLIPKYTECSLKNNNSTTDKYNLKIYDLYGDLIGINLIYIHQIKKYVPVATYTYILMYFLTNYYLEDDENIKIIYLNYYSSLNSIINIIQYLYYKYPEEYSNTENFNSSCFNYSINTSGKKNYPDNFYYYITNFENLVQNNKNLNTLPQKNYISYPKCDIKNTFDISKSAYYNEVQNEVDNVGISGITLNLKNILD